MNLYEDLGWGNYAEGARKSTAGKPLNDNNIDKISPQSASKIRKQTHWLNVNGTDIPAMVSMATARTIGVSVNIQVESSDSKFNKEAENSLKNFHKLGVGELTNKHHGNSAFRAISDFDLLDGGIIVRHHYNTAWAFPYKYELVPVDMIDISKGTGRKNDQDHTLNGIVYNKWNQPTHLYLYKTDDKLMSDKVSLKNITYYSDVWASLGQQTAISKLASILPTLDQVKQFGQASLDNAIEAAKSGAYLKSTAYNEIMLALRDQISKVSPIGQQNKLDSAIDYAKPILDRLASIGVKPYGLTPIPSEDSVEFDNRKRDSEYIALNNNSEMKMGAAIGMSDISVYSKADKVNYSAIKYISETDGLSTSIRFDNIARKILDDINGRAVEIGVQIGEIKARKAYWENPEDFKKFRYLRQISIDIEPGKTAGANNLNLKNRLVTEAEIIEKREGIPYEVWLAKEKETKEMKITQQLELEKFEKDLRTSMNLDVDPETNPEESGKKNEK